MGSTTRSTAAYAGAITAATITDIRTRVVSGGLIRRSDIEAIYNGIFNAASHTHSYYDQTALYDFGNVNRGSSAVTRDTGGGSNGQTAPGLSTVIYASQVSTMQSAAAGWKNHTHTHIADA
jgi:hypothetical protein